MPTTIKATSKKTGRRVDFERDFGENLDQAVQMFGAETVYSMFCAEAQTRAQNAARQVLNQEDSSEAEAVEAGQAYVPGVQRPRASAGREKAINTLADQLAAGTVTEEQLLEMLRNRSDGRDEEG